MCSWLFACAQSGSIVPVEQHLLQPPPDHLDPRAAVAAAEEVRDEKDMDMDNRPTAECGPPTAEGADGVMEGITPNEEGPPPVRRCWFLDTFEFFVPRLSPQVFILIRPLTYLTVIQE